MGPISILVADAGGGAEEAASFGGGETTVGVVLVRVFWTGSGGAGSVFTTVTAGGAPPNGKYKRHTITLGTGDLFSTSNFGTVTHQRSSLLD